MNYPNAIGQASPSGKAVHALIVESRDADSELHILVMDTILNRGGRILSEKGYTERRQSTISLVLDLRNLQGSVDDLLIQVRGLKHVEHADIFNMKNRMFDGLLFPIVLMETHRVVAAKSSLIFDIQEKLNTKPEKSILLEVGRNYGMGIVNEIRQKFEASDEKDKPVVDSQLLKRNVRDYVIATGWGKITWESKENVERVLIQDPPEDSKGNGTGNFFLHGIIAGTMEGIAGKQFGVIEDHYNQQTRLLTLTLVEQATALLVEKKTGEQTLTDEQKTNALQEVERIITSVAGGESVESKLNPQSENEVVSSASGNRVHVTLKRKVNNGKTDNPKAEENATKVSSTPNTQPKIQESTEPEPSKAKRIVSEGSGHPALNPSPGAQPGSAGGNSGSTEQERAGSSRIKRTLHYEEESKDFGSTEEESF